MESTVKTKIKIQVVFFLQAAVNCGIFSVITLYFIEIGLSGKEIGFILSMAAISAVVSPFISMHIADRYISAEKLFSLCSIVSSFLLFFLRHEKDFFSIAILYFFIMLFFSPLAALLNVMAFRLLGKARGKFGTLRVWGTFGWMFMLLFFSYVWLGDSFFKGTEKSVGDILFFSSALSMVLGIFVFIMDLSKNKKSDAVSQSKNIVNDLSAGYNRRHGQIRLFDVKKCIPFFLISFFIYILDKYFYFGISPFLKELGVQEKWILPVISSGNIMEVVLMFCLFPILSRFGFKKTLIVGTVAHFIRFVLFVIASVIGPESVGGGGSSAAAVTIAATGVLFHGISYVLFCAAGFIYLDLLFSEHNRAKAQLFYSFAVAGGSKFFGNLTAGVVLDSSLSVFNNYLLFWSVPLIISLISCILVVLFIDNSTKL